MKKIVDRFPAGVVDVPPSKSVAHRALICAALAAREAAAQNADRMPINAETLAASVGLSMETASDDIRATAEGICLIVREWARGGLVDCGESGSTLRFLIPIAAATGGEWAFSGRGRLLARPMEIYETIFAARGARFARTDDEGGRIFVKGPLCAETYELSGDVSSQFVTGLLLALPLFVSGDESLRNREIRLSTRLASADYVNLTIDVMRAFGVRVNELGSAGYDIPAGQRYAAPDGGFRVEGDWSQAAFFLCAGALGRDVSVRGLDPESRQGDRRVTEILARMGARVQWENETVRALPQADAPLCGVEIDARDIPDIVPPLAALACFAQGVTRFTGAQRLRIKESDRLAALAGELSKIGADIRETDDGLLIQGAPSSAPRVSARERQRLSVAQTDARGDHRIAMALAVAAIAAKRQIEIDGAESVAKSYPNFWEDFGAEYQKNGDTK